MSQSGSGQHESGKAGTGKRRRVRSWPVLIICLPASVAIWSGWIGLGEMTGFGVMHPLPGIADDVQLNTAVALPIGMEAYAAFALYVWLTPGMPRRARRFACWSAILALTVGAAGQVAYHVMASMHLKAAPSWVTTVVACIPVAVLGMGASLVHLLRDRTEDADDEPSGGRESFLVRSARNISQARAELQSPPPTSSQVAIEAPSQTGAPLAQMATSQAPVPTTPKKPRPRPSQASQLHLATPKADDDEASLTPLLRKRLTDLLTEYGAEVIPGREKVMTRMKAAGYDGWSNGGEAGRLIRIAKAKQSARPNGHRPANVTDLRRLVSDDDAEERPQHLEPVGAAS